jgi:hypothetical protein
VNTSKLAVVGRSADAAADVDYLSGQVSIDRRLWTSPGRVGTWRRRWRCMRRKRGSRWAGVRIREVSSGQILGGEVLNEPAERYADGAMPGTGTPIGPAPPQLP